MKTKQNKYLFSLISVFALMLASFSVSAEAGKSLFVYGKVELHNSTGQINTLSKGAVLAQGDRVVTGINGRTQLRMSDGAVFDLKPNTEFVIENYSFNEVTNNGRIIASTESKGFYRLMRGGFRAISGLIGKKNKKNYKVTTPVATIGIRGTDYTLQFCANDCNLNGAVANNGLYASVLEGGITLSNDGGALDVDPGEYAFVVDANTAPVFTSSAVKADSDEEEPSVSIDREGADEDGNTVSIESGDDAPSSTPDSQPTAARAAFAGNSVAGNVNGDLQAGSGSSVTGFSSGDASYDQGTANTVNQGNDGETGLYWGRWANGTATTTSAAGTSQVDLNNSSLHWIQASNQIKRCEFIYQ